MTFPIYEKIQEYKRARDELFELVELFPTEKLEEALFDGSTLKELILRITLADAFTIAVFEDFRRGNEVSWEDPYEEGDAAVNYPVREWEDVLDKFAFVGEMLFETFDLYPSKMWVRKIWENKHLTPEKILEIELNHYRTIYIPEILIHLLEPEHQKISS